MQLENNYWLGLKSTYMLISATTLLRKSFFILPSNVWYDLVIIPSLICCFHIISKLCISGVYGSSTELLC